MNRVLKMLAVVALILAAAVGLYIGGNMLYATLTDFQPASSEELEIHNRVVTEPLDSVFTFLIWNIGYSGLGAKEDFFYDGGKMVRAPEERVRENLDGIKKFISQHRETDFILLQEVDVHSKRSRYINEREEIAGVLPHHTYSFATNYQVDFVPVPLNNPPWQAMGRVKSGLTSFSKYPPVDAVRYQFPGSFEWPKRVYMLDRCFLVQRFNLPYEKQLVVINTHNSAYDDQGKLKQQEMQFLKEWLLEEYEKGSYIIVGGDWNQVPPNFDYQKFGKDAEANYSQLNIPEDYLPGGWQWIYDENVPTNRKLTTAYESGKTFTTLIDFYLVSPNVQVLEVQGKDLDFQNSDHQPVFLKVKLD